MSAGGSGGQKEVGTILLWSDWVSVVDELSDLVDVVVVVVSVERGGWVLGG